MNFLKLPDISHPGWFAVTALLIFLVVILRYCLIAGLFYLIFYYWFPHKWAHRKLGKRSYRKNQFKKEVAWSMLTAMIFALTGAVLVVLWQNDYTRIYTQIKEYPLWWMPVSLVVAFFLHETYYYWLHRWMHQPRIFSIVHRVHHDSNITSPWTAFSFHPLEGLFQAIFLPALLILMPMHLYVLLIHLSFMTLTSVINHLDIEIYSKRFHRSMFGRWLIGATHHALHHKQFRHNFGLYFTFWDKWQKTESPEYEEWFEQHSNRG